MTDQPTKGPFSNAQWTMIFDYMVRVDRLTDRAEFSGPNREANARRFMLMDELVEAMKPRLSKKARAELEQTAEAEENDGSAALADAIRFLLEQEDRRAAILAKIKGDAK